MRSGTVEAESIDTKVREALEKVIDPETGLGVMRMDLIHNIVVTADGAVSLVFRPSSPVCPMAYSLSNSIKKTIESIKGVASIEIRVENFEKAAHLERLLRSTGTQHHRKAD